MESTAQEVPTVPSAEARSIEAMKAQAANMTGWLKFLGIISIIQGALTALSIVGIIIAWLPIWMGVLLFQAGDRATRARNSADGSELAGMLEKLKLYFVIQGILVIVMLAFVILFFVFFSSVVFNGLHQLGNVSI